MIVQLSADSSAVLIELDRLDRLHATASGDLVDMRFAPWCRADADGDHVWLDVARCRQIGSDRYDEDWAGRFDAMVEYATSKGWTDPSGTELRAHIETTDSPGG